MSTEEDKALIAQVRERLLCFREVSDEANAQLCDLAERLIREREAVKTIIDAVSDWCDSQWGTEDGASAEATLFDEYQAFKAGVTLAEYEER